MTQSARVVRTFLSADNVGMQTQAVLGLAMTLAALQGQPIKPLPAIEVTTPADMRTVGSLNDAIGTLSEKVTACFSARRTTEDCRCKYPQDLARVRKGYDTVIQQHPEWKDQLLSYQYVNKEGRSVSGTLVLENLRRQLETLKCE